MSSPPIAAPASPAPPGRRRRSPTRRVLRVAGVVVGALLVVGGADRLVRDTTVQTDALGPDGIRSIVVETTAGRVTMATADREDVEVVGEVTSGMFSDGDLDVRREGDVLRLLGDCDGVVFTSCTVRLDVTLPRDLVPRVEVRTRAGEIDLRGLGGDVDVATTAGAVRVLDFDGEVARVVTTAGEIRVDAGAGTRALDLHTTAGSIAVVADDAEPWRVDVSTAVGREFVDVARSAEADRLLVARTTAGEVTVTGR